MYKVLKRTCFAIVLPIRFFVSPHCRCRRRRGFLKVTIEVCKITVKSFFLKYKLCRKL